MYCRVSEYGAPFRKPEEYQSHRCPLPRWNEFNWHHWHDSPFSQYLCILPSQHPWQLFPLSVFTVWSFHIKWDIHSSLFCAVLVSLNAMSSGLCTTWQCSISFRVKDWMCHSLALIYWVWSFCQITLGWDAGSLHVLGVMKNSAAIMGM